MRYRPPYGPGWPRTHFVVQADPKLWILTLLSLTITLYEGLFSLAMCWKDNEERVFEHVLPTLQEDGLAFKHCKGIREEIGMPVSRHITRRQVVQIGRKRTQTF